MVTVPGIGVRSSSPAVLAPPAGLLRALVGTPDGAAAFRTAMRPACGQLSRAVGRTWHSGGVTATTHDSLFPAVPDSADAVLDGLDPEQRAVATALHGPVCVLAGRRHRQDPGDHPPDRLRRARGHTPARAACSPSPSPRGRRARCAAGCAQLGAGGVQARTFHSAALRQLQYFWPRAVGGEMPRLVERKVQLVAEAAAALPASGWTAPSCATSPARSSGARSPRPSPRTTPAAAAKAGRDAAARPGRGGPDLRRVRGAQAGPRRRSTSRTCCC